MSKKTEEINKAMKNKQMKKIVLILLLAVIVGALVYVVIAKPSVEKQDNTTKTFTQIKDDENEIVKSDNGEIDEEYDNTNDNVGENEIIENNDDTKNLKETTVTKFKDGTLYSISGESIKPDIIVGNNYFDTQLSDVNTNFSTYEGKTVEIEGFYMEDTPYTFVGRYSESNLCAYCPQGYSYFEYEWHGDKKPDLTHEGEWLKIIGTYRQGHDEMGDYYYIDASSIKVMNEWGQDTVKN